MYQEVTLHKYACFLGGRGNTRVSNTLINTTVCQQDLAG